MVCAVVVTSLAGVAEAQPSFSKAFAPATIGPGSTSTLTFTITNGSGSPVTDLAFTDTLPAEATIATPSNADTTCIDGTLNAPDGGSTISYSGGSIGASSSCVVTVNVTSTTVGTHQNVSGDLTSSAGNSGPASDDLVVDGSRPGFTKSFSPNTIGFGGRTTLTFTIDNTLNQSAAFNLTFSDTLPGGLTVADPANASTTCSGTGTVTAAPGTAVVSYGFSGFVAASNSCTVSVDVAGSAGGTFTNVTGDLTSLSGSSGKATAELTVTTDRLLLTKEFTDDPLTPGATGTLELTILNTDRTQTATGLTFTDDLDATLSGLVAVPPLPSDPCGPGSSLSGTSLLTLTGGALAPEATCTFSVPIQIPAGATAGIYPNTTSTLTGDLGGSPVTSSAATDSLLVNEAPRLTKTFLTNPVGAGDTVDMQFTITNTSSGSPATDIGFEDPLGTFLSGVSVTSLPAAGFCGGGSNAFVTTIGGIDTLLVTGANLVASGSCTLTVGLQVPAGAPMGSYVNTTGAISGTVDGTLQVGKPASDTLTVVSPPTLQKEFTDDPVLPGGTVTLELTISHAGTAPADATAISFTDDLNAALTGLAATGLPQTDVCGTGSQISGTSLLSFTGGTLAPGATCTFSVVLDVPAGALPGTYDNVTSNVTATVSGVTATRTGASDQLHVAGLTLAKEFIDDPVIPGQTATLRFTIDNSSPTLGATDIFFTDNLSAVLSGLAAVAPLPTTPCGAGSSLSGTTPLVFTGGEVAANSSCTFDVTVQVPAAAADGSYNNVTSSMTATVDGAPVTLDPAADVLEVSSSVLELTKAFTDDPVSGGDSVTLEFTVTNLDPDDTVTGITFTDDLDAALTGLQATTLPADGFCGAGSQLTGAGLLTMTGGSLGPGASCTFSTTLQVPAVVPSTNAVNTTSSVFGSVGGLAVVGPPTSDTLQLVSIDATKSFAAGIAAGSTQTLSFTLTNLSTTQSAGSLRFTDDLDAVLSGLVAIGLPQAGVCGSGSVLTGSSVVELVGGSLPPGGSCTFDVTVQAPVDAVPGTYPNTTSDITDSGLLAGDPATADLVVEPPPGFSKSFAPNPTIVGGTTTLTLTIENSTSTIAATDLDVTDILPAGLTVAPVPNAITTCTGGTITTTGGSSTVSYSGGTVPAGSSCTVSVDVVASAVGNLINTTGVLTSSSGDSGTAQATLRVNPPPGFAKAFAPTAVPVDGESTLTLTINNASSTADAVGLDVTDNLPAGMEVAATPNASTTCTGGTLTAPAGGSTISYSGGTVLAGGSCAISVDVIGTAVGTLPNTTGDLTSSLGSSGTATANLTVAPAPGFAKTFVPTAVPLNGASVLTLTIDNASSVLDASALDVTDSLPAGIEVAATPNASTTCAGGSLTAVAGSGSVSYSGGTVAAGATCTVTVDVIGTAFGTLTNTTGELTSSLGSSGTAAADLTVVTSPAFSKAFSPNAVAVDGVSTLTLTIDNTGVVLDATGLDVTDNLPAGMEVAATPNASTTCTGGTLTATAGATTISYSGGTVAAGGTCSVTADVTGTAVDTLTNTTGELTSSLGSSGTAAADLTVVAAPGFGKAFAPTSVAVDGVTTLTLTIDNTGGVLDATGVDVIDNLPAGMEVAATPNAATTCTGGALTAAAGDSSFSYSGGTVAAGATCTVSVDVAGTVVGTLTNTTGELTSSLGSSGTASADLIVDPAPAISKSFAPTAISIDGGLSTLALTIDNAGSSQDATDLDVTDTFPSGIEVAAAPNATTTCTGGTLTATAGSGSISYTGGSVAAAGTCTVAVDVTGTAAGTVTNTTGELTSSLGSSGTASADLTVDPVPVFAKAFDPAAIAVNGVSTLTLTVDNSGSSQDATALDVTDSLPVGMEVAAAPNAATTCTGGTLTATAGAVSISYTGGSVAAGASCVVTVDVTGTVEGTLTNTTGELTSSLGSSGSASADLDVQTVAVFVVSKTFLPDPVLRGGDVVLEYTITNASAVFALGNIGFTDDLDSALAGLTAVTLPAGTVCGGGTLSGSSLLTFAGGSLAPSASCTFQATLSTPGDAALGFVTSTTSTPTADVTGAPVDGEAATADVEVTYLQLAKAFVGETSPGGTVPLEFTIANPDALNGASQISFSDDLDAVMPGLTAVDVPQSDVCGIGSLLDGSPLLQLTGGSLPAGGTCTFSVLLQVPIDAAIGDFENVTSELEATVAGVATTGDASGVASDILSVLRTSIPALGAWGLGMLIGLVALLGWRFLRQR